MTDICKAIVIGGSPKAQHSIRQLLMGSPCTPHFIREISAVRELLNPKELALVIVDLETDTDAQLEICRLLKASTDTVLLPVIALSRLARHRLAAFEAGVDECLLRPFKLDHFRTRLHALVQASAVRRQIASAELDAEIERREHLRSIFRRYVSPQLADQILARLEVRDGSVEWGSLANSRTRAAVMFADMRGFMGLAERLNPAEVFDLLNEFFALLTDIVFKYDGTVFHMAGDCLMSGFGVPIQQADGAQRAIKAAREMLTSFAALAEQWKTRYEIDTGLGIGINEGEVIAGDLGSPHYMNYTLIGDTVNVASRLSQRARAGEVLFSNAFKITLDAKGFDVGAVELPPLLVRGRTNPIDIFCVPTERRTDFRIN